MMNTRRWEWLVIVVCAGVVLAVADMNLDKALGLQGQDSAMGFSMSLSLVRCYDISALKHFEIIRTKFFSGIQFYDRSKNTTS